MELRQGGGSEAEGCRSLLLTTAGWKPLLHLAALLLSLAGRLAGCYSNLQNQNPEVSFLVLIFLLLEWCLWIENAAVVAGLMRNLCWPRKSEQQPWSWHLLTAAAAAAAPLSLSAPLLHQHHRFMWTTPVRWWPQAAVLAPGNVCECVSVYWSFCWLAKSQPPENPHHTTCGRWWWRRSTITTVMAVVLVQRNRGKGHAASSSLLPLCSCCCCCFVPCGLCLLWSCSYCLKYLI